MQVKCAFPKTVLEVFDYAKKEEDLSRFEYSDRSWLPTDMYRREGVGGRRGTTATTTTTMRSDEDIRN